MGQGHTAERDKGLAIDGVCIGVKRVREVICFAELSYSDRVYCQWDKRTYKRRSQRNVTHVETQTPWILQAFLDSGCRTHPTMVLQTMLPTPQHALLQSRITRLQTTSLQNPLLTMAREAVGEKDCEKISGGGSMTHALPQSGVTRLQTIGLQNPLPVMTREAAGQTGCWEVFCKGSVTRLHTKSPQIFFPAMSKKAMRREKRF